MCVGVCVCEHTCVSAPLVVLVRATAETFFFLSLRCSNCSVIRLAIAIRHVISIFDKNVKNTRNNHTLIFIFRKDSAACVKEETFIDTIVNVRNKIIYEF